MRLKLIFTLLALVFGALFFLMSKKNPQNLSSLDCDINLNSCQISTKNGEIYIDISPRPIAAMQEFELSVTNLQAKNLKAKISGVNMDMGDIWVDFKGEGTKFSANVVISACLLKTMRYALEFFDDKKPLGVKFYFDLHQ